MPRPSGCFTSTASAARIPTEPPSSGPFPYPPVSHEPRIQALSDQPRRRGPAPVPSAAGHSARREGRQGRRRPASASAAMPSTAFPACLNGKADAQVMCVDPALKAHPNLTLLTGAYVSRLETDPPGTWSTASRSTRGGEERALLGRYRRGRLRRAVVRAAAAALRQRQPSERSRQRLGPGRAQLHAPQPIRS